MKQNKYDDAAFFAKYEKIPRSVYGLDGAAEWPVFRSLLPDLRGKRALDLGCGYGWHCRYLREQGAVRVVGIDLSEKMLAEARARSADCSIEYRRCPMEDIAFAEGEFDLAISSLALHYIEDFPALCRKVYRSLSPGGSFVFSVEHPMLTALAAQEWHLGPAGERLHWPVDDYQDEGRRHTRWLGEDVLKYHRTIATYINGLIEAGFRISKVIEPSPSAETRAQHPDLKDEHRRPAFLLIANSKPE
ncbi:MAG TPA: class I SAM-dependent methyltransferase [Candidatus Acidoferrum sp.]|nr:class I SAM-dependent methyltransferase [Candidatus Acidoferrum sp.]